MKQFICKTLLVCLFGFSTPGSSFAQLVSGDVFLKGKYVEVGIAPNGAFGSKFTAPSGYHGRSGSSLDPAGAIGFIADPDKDGWTSGTPAFIGDYFMPYNPQEGWDIEINGLRGKAWRGSTAGMTGTGFSGLLTGSNTSFVSSGGKSVGTWTGTMGDLSIVQTTTLDTDKLYFVINVKLTNTGDTTLTNIYYDRTLDPDQGVMHTAPILTRRFVTKNTIVSQISSTSNSVLVSAEDTTPVHAYLGLGTKDCRAKCYALNVVSLIPVGSLSNIYAEATSSFNIYNVGATTYRDAAIGIVFKLDSLQAGDSTTLVYAYILKLEDLDSALLQVKSKWLVDGVPHNSGDTIKPCPGKNLDVQIMNGDAYSWVWTPVTALSATTGKTNTIATGSSLVTYRVVGTSTTSSCVNNDTLFLIIAPKTAPSAPTVITPVNFCLGDAGGALSATKIAGTDTIYWFNTATGGVGSLIAPALSSAAVGTNYYFAGSKSVNGCESPRAKISVYTNPLVPSFNIKTADSILCLGENTKLGVGLGGTDSINSPIVGATAYNTGVMFDIVGKKAVTINGFDIHTGAVTDEDISVYYRKGTHVGFDSNPAAWTLLGTTKITGTYGTISKIPLPVNVTMFGGDTLAFYFTCDGYVGYNYGTAVGNTLIEDANIKILEGRNKATPLFAGGVSPRCFNGKVRYSAVGIAWNTLAITDTIAVAPSTSTNYWAKVTNIVGCNKTDTMQVQVNPLPSAPTVSSPVFYCQNAVAVPMTASKATATDTLYWYNTASGGVGTLTAPTPTTATVGSTIYYVGERSAAGCDGNRTPITVTINPPATAPTVSSPVKYCIGATASALTATKAFSTDTLYWYTVSSGGTGSIAAPTPSTASAGTTSYYVSSKSVLGCEGNRTPLAVNINGLATAPTVVTPVTYCQNATALVLTATTAAPTDTLYWYTVSSGGTGVLTAPTPSTVSAGTTNYYVSAKSSSGCEGSRTLLVVNINPLPSAPVVTTPVNYCIGSTPSALSATGTGLLWYNAASGGTGSASAPTPSTSALGTTNYYVTQTNATTFCESPRALIAVNVNPIPAAPTVVSPLNLCIGATASALTATGTNLKWYSAATGGTGSSTAPTPSTTSLGSTNYYVSQSSSFNCESPRAVLTVNVQPLPVVTISSLSPYGFIYCEALTVTLKAIAPAATSFQWKFAGTNIAGATADTIAAGMTGNWGVTVTSVYGCKAQTEVYVRQDTTRPPVLSPSEAKICKEGSVLLTAHPGFVTYLFEWMKDGSPLGSATLKENLKNASAAGSYYVIVTNNYGCIDTTNVSVVTNYPSPPKPIILNTDPILSVASGYRYYQWYFNFKKLIGANKNSHKMAGSGYYYVEVSDENGCIINSDTINYIQSTGMQTVSKTELKIYPNPTNSLVHLEAATDLNVIVSDVTGRIVLSEKGINAVDLSRFVSGTYIFRIMDQSNNLISIEKITKTD